MLTVTCGDTLHNSRQLSGAFLRPTDLSRTKVHPKRNAHRAPSPLPGKLSTTEFPLSHCLIQFLFCGHIFFTWGHFFGWYISLYFLLHDPQSLALSGWGGEGKWGRWTLLHMKRYQLPLWFGGGILIPGVNKHFFENGQYVKKLLPIGWAAWIWLW